MHSLAKNTAGIGQDGGTDEAARYHANTSLIAGPHPRVALWAFEAMMTVGWIDTAAFEAAIAEPA